MAKYVQEGKVIDVLASAEIKNSDVVSLATRIGVATNDIANGSVGPVQVVGVFEFPKASGEITVGANVYWDPTNKNITTTAPADDNSNVPAGFAIKAAASADTTCLVKIG